MFRWQEFWSSEPPGRTNDEENAHAFQSAGAEAECVHVGELLRGERRLDEFDIFSIPGGFSYGDDLGAGTVLANQFATRLGDALREFVAEGRLVVGICNGFQVLVRLGILPGWDEGASPEGGKVASLIENVSGKFEARWVTLRVGESRSPFLSFARAPSADDAVDASGHSDPGRMETGDSEPGHDEPVRYVEFPVAHKEGRFVLRDADVADRLARSGQIAFTYCRADREPADGQYPDNPNGSTFDIAGITNPAGNVLGLMPHPERFIEHWQHPCWTRSRPETPAEGGRGQGFAVFESAVRYVDARGAVARG